MTLKNGVGQCSLFVLSANGCFPAKENPNMEKELFDWPIVLQYDVKAKYRLISRKLLACEQALLFGQTKRASGERASEGPRRAPRGFAARSRVLARLVSLVQIGELARRLESYRVYTHLYPFDKPIKSLYFRSFVSVLFTRFHFKVIRKWLHLQGRSKLSCLIYMFFTVFLTMFTACLHDFAF